MALLRNLMVATAMVLLAGGATAKPILKQTPTTPPVGTVSIDETQIGFLVGGSAGGGVLSFGGKTHKFKIGGLSIGNIGVSKLKATGQVFNMTDISQFAGTYAKAEASATFGSGKGTLRLENDKGVVLELKTTSGGVQLSASGGGVKISMAKK